MLIQTTEPALLSAATIVQILSLSRLLFYVKRNDRRRRSSQLTFSCGFADSLSGFWFSFICMVRKRERERDRDGLIEKERVTDNERGGENVRYGIVKQGNVWEEGQM